MASPLSVSSTSGPPLGDRIGWALFGLLGCIFTVIGLAMLFGADAASQWIAGAVFSAAGLGAIAAGLWVRRIALERHELRRRDPRRPWRWRRDWLAGRVESDARVGSFTLWAFTVLWNLMSLPVWLGMAGAAIFFAWIFPAVGLVLLFVALRATLRAWRYGRSVFVMPDVPGVLGGPLGGEVHVARALGDASQAVARLSCHRHISDGTRELWQEELPVRCDRMVSGSAGAVLPIAFTVPYGLPASHADVVSWYLEVSAEASATDYHARFEVPVFETSESSPAIDERAAAPPPAAKPELGERPERVMEGSRIRVGQHGRSLEIVFPALRSPGASVLLAGAWLFWGLITLVFMGWDGWTGIPLKLLLLGGGLYLSWAWLDTVFGWVRLRVREGRLERTYRWLGIGWTRAWGGDRVSGFAIRFRGRLGRIDFYDLRVERLAGRPRTLARGIRGKRLAETLRDWVERAFAGADPGVGGP